MSKRCDRLCIVWLPCRSNWLMKYEVVFKSHRLRFSPPCLLRPWGADIGTTNRVTATFKPLKICPTYSQNEEACWTRTHLRESDKWRSCYQRPIKKVHEADLVHSVRYTKATNQHLEHPIGQRLIIRIVLTLFPRLYSCDGSSSPPLSSPYAHFLTP